MKKYYKKVYFNKCVHFNFTTPAHLIAHLIDVDIHAPFLEKKNIGFPTIYLSTTFFRFS